MVPKDANIILRISPEDKDLIEKAAGAHGQSVTTFMVRAALQKANRTDFTPGVMHGVPTFFKALCYEASQGGGYSYRDVGRKLASSIASFIPDDLGYDEWDEKVQELGKALTKSDTWDDALEWFEHYIPKCWKLIPKRKQVHFAEGAAEFAEEEGLSI